MFTTCFIPRRTAIRRGHTFLSGVACALIPLALVACAATPQVPNDTPASSDTLKATPAVHLPNATASYHFMLGYQAELAQDMDRA
ncbi:MAG: hypothetical protein ABI604_21080, partial [Nitrospirota bacterium]